MKRVIRFSNARFWFYGISLTLILIGVGGFVFNHGLNLGVDFKAGISLQFQVAPASFTVQYQGAEKATLSIPAGEEAIASPGDIIFKVTSVDGTTKSYPFIYRNYSSVKALTDDIMKQVAGVGITLTGDPNLVPTDLLPLPRPANLSAAAYTVNSRPAAVKGVQTAIGDMRSVLGPMGDFSLQQVGADANQEFMARFPVKAGTNEATFQNDIQTRLMSVLEAKYGAGQVILKSTEFSSARMAQSLTSQTIWLVLIALVLILLYMIFRFHPWVYGVAAIMGVVHDALIMIGFDAVFRVEIDTGTIAAILTILGYSINDTIVNFDRTRENTTMMRGQPLRSIIDTSITQTLSRTFITSGATLLTVLAFFILTTGTIKNFALNMIVGIVEGTYSTFLSSFFVIEWINWREKSHKDSTLRKWGIIGGGADDAKADAAAEESADAPALTADGQIVGEQAEAGEPAAAGVDVGHAAAQGTVPAGATETDAAAQAGPTQPKPASSPVQLGHAGSRKNKKHRRNH
jgi:preprotein translocase subunit SecF